MIKGITNFAQWIFDSNRDQPHKIAIIDDTGSLTYQELETHSRSFAGYLLSLGIKPQQRVMLCMDDSKAWPVAFFGCLLMGANPVFVSKDLPEHMVRRVQNITDAVAMISDRDWNLSGLQYINSGSNMLPHSGINDSYEWHPDEACYWLLSSGSTGDNKCMVHRHSSLYYLFLSVSQPAYDINRHSVILNTAKMSFTYGFNNGVNYGLGSGATVVVMKGPPAPSRIMERLKQHRVTHFFTVPTIINSMIKHYRGDVLPESVSHMVCSTEPLPESLRIEYERLYQCRIYNGIGMSETTQTYCSQTPDNYEPGTLGQPLPGIEMKLLDDTLQPVGDNEIGEIWVKSPCAAYVYWKDWEATKRTFQGPWIKTGDKARRTSQGNYVYVSRADDLIKINGLFVSPIDIESEILKIIGVEDCAVVADHENGLPIIHAHIVGNTDVDTVRQYLKDVLQSHMMPRRFTFVDQLPRTVTFKKRRALLRQENLHANGL